MAETTTQQYNNPLGSEKISTLLRQFAIPSIIAMLVTSLYNIVDQLFIGHAVGTLGNAATNITFPMAAMCISIALLCGIGGAATYNLHLGRGDEKSAPYFIGNSATFMVILGIVFSAVMLIWTDQLLVFAGCPDDVLPYARDYTWVCALGFPALILSAGGAHLVRADGSPNFTMALNIIGAIINTVLDAIFVLGLGWGMKGAALATIIGQYVAAILVVWYFFHWKTTGLSFKYFIPNLAVFAKVASLGLAPCFNQLALMVTQIVMNKSLNYYGARSVYGKAIPIAVCGIVIKCFQVSFAFIIGLSQGLQPIISFNYGARNYDRVKKAFVATCKIGAVISLSSWILFMSIPSQILSLFGNGSDLYFQYGAKFFRVFLLTCFLGFMQPTASTFFTAIGKPFKGVFLSLTRQIIFLIPLMIVLPLFLGLDGIMCSMPIADGLSFITCTAMIIYEFNHPEFKSSEKESIQE